MTSSTRFRTWKMTNQKMNCSVLRMPANWGIKKMLRPTKDARLHLSREVNLNAKLTTRVRPRFLEEESGGQGFCGSGACAVRVVGGETSTWWDSNGISNTATSLGGSFPVVTTLTPPKITGKLAGHNYCSGGLPKRSNLTIWYSEYWGDVLWLLNIKDIAVARHPGRPLRQVIAYKMTIIPLWQHCNLHVGIPLKVSFSLSVPFW